MMYQLHQAQAALLARLRPLARAASSLLRPPHPGRPEVLPLSQAAASLQLTWDVLLSSVRSGSHGMISDGSVRTVSRFEPVCVLAIPSQYKLTFGRRTRQPHHHPAYGG